MSPKSNYLIHPVLRYAHGLLAILTAALPLDAQIDPPSDDPGNDMVYLLDAFEVSVENDRGYISTNAISGTSLNTAIRDLPMPLEVINQEFIEDLQAVDLRESLAYSSGVYTETFANNTGANPATSRETSPSTVSNVNNPFANTVSIRGYAVPNQQRYGFRVGALAVGEGFGIVLGGITDTSNIERMEVVRGPASLLYGVSVLSGVVNMLPKEPLFENRVNVQATVGSNNFYRSTLDITGPVFKGKLAYRVMANFQDNESHIDFRHDEQEYYVGQLKWMPNRKTNVLFELQYAEQWRRGIGSRFFTDRFLGQSNQIDANPTNPIDFRNPFNEYIQFGYDLPEDFMTRDPADPDDIWLLGKSNPLAPQENRSLGEDYNISGPDTFQNRRELNALLLLRTSPVKNLNIELGGYYTKVDQLERNLNMGVYGNSEGPLSTRINVESPADRGPAANYVNEFVRNPEITQLFGGALPPAEPGRNALARGTYLLDDRVGFSVTADDVPNYIGTLSSVTSGALGEVFVVPDIMQRGRPGGNPQANTWNPKVARYIWTETPTESESIQLRARAAYTFETKTPAWMGGPSLHTITAGHQYIQDELLVVTGGANVRQTITYGEFFNSDTPGDGFGRLGEDPYVLRDSVFDYTPIRHNGEPMAIPGSLNFSRSTLGSALVNDLGRDKEYKIAASGWRELTATYNGTYAVYQGKFWEDRITFIGGVRRDGYQIEEAQLLRALDGVPSKGTALTDFYRGTGEISGTTAQFTVLPVLIGDGSQPYTPDRWDPSLPDQLNLEIQRQVDLLRESLGPDGTRKKLFPQEQTFDTRTAGLSFRIAEPLSIYLLYSEGVFPNQGQRDGLDRPIPAEMTESREIGFKFELLDRKISGTVSFYQIKRDNATWFFDAAPTPRKWIGGRLGPNEEALDPFVSGTPLAFDAQSYLSGDGVKARVASKIGIPDDEYQRLSYGVVSDFLKDVWEEQIGTAFPESLNDDKLRDMGLGWARVQGLPVVGAQFENLQRQDTQFFFTDPTKEFVEGKHISEEGLALIPAGIDTGLMLKEAFDRALAERDYDGNPIYWNHNENTLNTGLANNISNSTGDTVTFQEEATGVDGQIIFSPTKNYQAIFTFSWQEREVVGNGFNLAPLIDPVSGETIPGTLYDKWVYVLGADAFDDPTDPTSTNGNGINGLDLSFVPEWNFSLWNKFSFSEGRLEGLELLAGARYSGEAPTSVAIGDANSTNNRYPSPPIKERVVFDAGFNYSFDWLEVRWRLGVKIDNLLDDQISENIITYADLDNPGETQTRRSRVRYNPRTWRLTLTASF